MNRGFYVQDQPAVNQQLSIERRGLLWKWKYGGL